MRYHTFFLFGIFLWLAPYVAFSQDPLPETLNQTPWQHALAMHGDPKYSADFIHLDYADKNAPKGGILKQAIVGSFDTLNHHIILGETARGLAQTSDRLMHRVWDEPFTLYGLVAEKIKISPKRDWILFKLNPKAQFHDGRPMTAEDVKFSFETYREHGHPVRRRVYGLVDKVEILNAQEILFRFGPGYDQESALILAIMPVLPKHYWQDKDITKTTLTPPLGSGPYRIKTVDPGRKIIYERQPEYWGEGLAINQGHYNFDEIHYLYYRDASIALEAFKASETNLRREYDIKSWTTAYETRNANEARFIQKKYEHSRPEKVRAFIFNTRRAPFDDIRVRQALSLAFHFQHMNQIFFNSAFQRIESYFPNSELSHHRNSNLTAFHFPNSLTPGQQRENLRHAKTLLKQAGYIIQDKTLIHHKTLKPLTFEILLNASKDEKIALFFKETLQRLGIKVDIRTVDTAQFTGRLDQFDYDMVLYQWVNSLSPGAEQLNYWGEGAATLQGSRNYAGIQDQDIDRLALSISAATSRQDLVTQTQKLDSALMHGYYSIPLWYLGTDLIAHDRKLSSNGIAPLYGPVLETWWYEK